MTSEAESVDLQTIAEVVELEQREKLSMSFSDHIASFVTAVVGSMAMVWLNLLWFAAWIGGHESGILHIDPFPYGLLTMIVSLEAIFFSLFVLIAQNRQAQLADKRAKLDLQINVIAEHEVTKVIQMVEQLQRHLGLTQPDEEIASMRSPTRVEALAEAMEEVQATVDPRAAKGPTSAADTEA